MWFYTRTTVTASAGYLQVEVEFLLALICITLVAFHTNTSRSTFVGIFYVIVGILFYGAPFTVMPHVINTKSVKYMPLSLSIAGLCNGVIWSAYACINVFDPYILCAQQDNGVNCGLYVMRFMLDIMSHCTDLQQLDEHEPHYVHGLILYSLNPFSFASWAHICESFFNGSNSANNKGQKEYFKGDRGR
ncbi:bidirectional sugar transporter SWEET4-like [Chenopodium quinoa]|uniref:bidirectional sugar transporter SWEET4-like n=1 Tax=Chenopodium quinoa TaxID=63459 RepID=UPI000B7812D4|nr:bidirectional sugar transporter SWEET4-like [Chenopodium quinoa]